MQGKKTLHMKIVHAILTNVRAERSLPLLIILKYVLATGKIKRQKVI